MMKVYRGIDYADDSTKYGDCSVEDDGTTLRVNPASQAAPKRIGIDAPMGLPRGYVALLTGELPHDGSLTFRATDLRLQALVAALPVVSRYGVEVPKLFNRTGHVRSPAALQIVPGAMKEALECVSASTDSTERRRQLVEIRLGTAVVVEAHPRLFLYSMLQCCDQAVTKPLMTAARDYKDVTRKVEGAGHRERRPNNRRLLRDHLCEHTEWCKRQREVEADDSVLSTDHAFDAWLSALTAWSHDNGHTLTWNDAGLERETVEVEGHILILRTNGKAN